MMDKGFKSLFKIYFFGFIIFTLFLSILIVVLHPFGLSRVVWNGQEVTGVMVYILPFLVSFAVSLFFSLILSFFAWLGYKVMR